MLNSIEIEDILFREGFKLKLNNEKVHDFEHEDIDWIIYVKRPNKKSKALFVREKPLVITPELEDKIENFSMISGLNINIEGYYHNSNLNGYKKRINNGIKPIEYGIDIGFETDTVLLSFLDLLLGKTLRKPSANAEVDIENASKDIGKEKKTTREALVESRRGQGKYRDELLDLWKLCSISKFSMKEFLRASHIKPWRDSNNIERLDKFNGLLLNPTLDIAFDRGFISFDDDGVIIISKNYKEDLLNMGIDKYLKMKVVYPEQLKYLNWHRDHVLRKS